MNTPLKLLLGFLSLAPAVGLIWTAIQMTRAFVAVANAGGLAESEELAVAIEACLPVTIVTSMVTLAMLGFYIWHLVTQAKRKDTGFQVLWCLLLVLFALVAMPVYWCLYIWPERKGALRPDAA